jgi:hypothetical protein
VYKNTHKTLSQQSTANHPHSTKYYLTLRNYTKADSVIL